MRYAVVAAVVTRRSRILNPCEVFVSRKQCIECVHVNGEGCVVKDRVDESLTGHHDNKKQ